MNGFIATEAQEQEALIKWSQTYKSDRFRGTLSDYISASANGGIRPKKKIINPQTGIERYVCVEGKALARRGVKAGFPDLFIAVPMAPWHGMFIEMKRREKSKISYEQKQWMERLSAMGYFCLVSYGWENAVDSIKFYLRLENV